VINITNIFTNNVHDGSRATEILALPDRAHLFHGGVALILFNKWLVKVLVVEEVIIRFADRWVDSDWSVWRLFGRTGAEVTHGFNFSNIKISK